MQPVSSSSPPSRPRRWLEGPAPQIRVGKAVASHPVKTGLNGVAGFTFAPGGKIWYLDRGTGQVHVLNPKNHRDHLFFTITHVDGSGERGALGIALHPNWPKKPFVYIYVTRHLHGTTRNYLIRLRDKNGKGTGLHVLLSQPVGPAVPQRRAHPVRARSQALRDDRRRAQLGERPDPQRQQPARQDHATRPGRHRGRRQPARPRVVLRPSQLLRVHVRSEDEAACGKRRTAPSATTRST